MTRRRFCGQGQFGRTADLVGVVLAQEAIARISSRVRSSSSSRRLEVLRQLQRLVGVAMDLLGDFDAAWFLWALPSAMA